MKLRNPLLIRSAAFLASGLIRSWMSSVRYRIENRDTAPHPAHPRFGRFLYAFWHEALLVPTQFRVPTHVLISLHADGELIAQVCRHLGLGVVRGSTSRGGGRAMFDMIEAAGQTHLAITPDGPRGPRRRVQPGIVAMAAYTGLPVVPLGFGFTNAWRAKSWDRFAVPRPGSAVVVVAGPAIRVPRDLDRAGVEDYRAEIERQMLALTDDAERRAAGRDLRGLASRRAHFRRVAAQMRLH
jgi:lysophospholipid acyltransferase (LPLAT)-like uncharacterized protein